MIGTGGGGSTIQDVIEGGNRMLTTLGSTLIVLTSRFSGASNNGCFVRGNATTAYQVPVGKKLVVVHLRAVVIVVEAAARCMLVYSDNAIAAGGASTAFTNPVEMGGNQYGTPIHTESVGIQNCAVYFEVPAGKYLNMSGAGVNSVRTTAFCYLEDA